MSEEERWPKDPHATQWDGGFASSTLEAKHARALEVIRKVRERMEPFAAPTSDMKVATPGLVATWREELSSVLEGRE